VVNTGTTIITFLMVFIIQNTQTRDSRELHVKLDELLRAVAQARNRVILSEELTDEELERLQAELRSTALLDRRRQRRARESVSTRKEKEKP
jgi:low affinity Fe/Cu permease